MAAPPLIWSFISLVIGFLLRSLSGGPELLPAALGLGVSDCTPPALRGPYFLRRVPVNDFNWAALAAFTWSKKMCFWRIFLPSGSSGSHFEARSPQAGHYLPSSVGCIFIGTGLMSAGLAGFAGGFE